MNKPAMANLKVLPFGGAAFVPDPALVRKLENINISAWLTDTDISQRYLEKFRSWILSSKNNRIHGLENYPFAVQTNATTEAFDKFYIANHTRRFRCFRGEYMYHQAVWRNNWPDWRYIDDEPIQANDAVVVSFPFADTGGKHQDLDRVLAQCDELGVPVLIDCAYFGICGNLEFDFDHPSITAVTFALSKTFPVPNARIGIRFTKQDDDDGCFVYQKTNYTNRISAGMGLEFMESWGPDYIFDSYRSAQVGFCDQLGVAPSDTVIFGIGDERYQQYNRGGKTNRLGFQKYLADGKLPDL